MNGYMKSILLGAFILLTACVSAAKHTPAQTALVLDEETQLPIEGAIVVARWIGTISQLVDSQTTCYHVESATTDAQGQYSIPSWTKLPGKVHHNAIEVTVYKAGYRQVWVNKATGNQYLKRDIGSVEERLEYLKWLHGTTRCGAQNESENNRLPLLKALYEDVKLHGGGKKSAPNEMSPMESIQYDIEILELGFEEAERRHLKRP